MPLASVRTVAPPQKFSGAMPERDASKSKISIFQRPVYPATFTLRTLFEKVNHIVIQMR